MEAVFDERKVDEEIAAVCQTNEEVRKHFALGSQSKTLKSKLLFVFRQSDGHLDFAICIVDIEHFVIR
jgi:hypothetical protein